MSATVPRQKFASSMGWKGTTSISMRLRLNLILWLLSLVVLHVLGLGFYYIDAPVGREDNWLNFKICGLVRVVKGEVTEAELHKNLSGILCKNKQWPWQIRAVSEKSLLVRFPPWKNVNELIEFPVFDMPITGVSVSVVQWTNAINPFNELVEAFVVI